MNDGDSQGSKSIGKSGNESIVGFVGEGNEVMKNSVILVEKFDVQNFRWVTNTEIEFKETNKKFVNREKIEEINALWYRYSHSI